MVEDDLEGGRRAPRVALALSSGGARGFAHVGVVKGLREAGFTIAAVVGSSMGSVIAAGYALRGDIGELERRVLDFRARDHMRRYLPVMDPDRITAFFDDLAGGARFADCLVPLTVVATDLEARAPTSLTEGPVPLAMFASMATPFFHRPVRWQGHLLADGALSCVLPLPQAWRPDVDLVVGSMVSQEWPRYNEWLAACSRRLGHAARGWQRVYVDFFARRLPTPPSPPPPAPEPPELVLAPDLAGIGAVDFRKAREAIAAGERAVAARLDELRALLRAR